MALRKDPAKELDQLLSKIRRKVQPDIKIRCGSNEHPVHSFLLEDASNFFNKACNGPFIESHTREINLVEDNAEAVKAFVDWLYEGDYGATREDNNVLSRWRYHSTVYYFAVKYDIEALANEACQKFAAAVPTRNFHNLHAGLVAELVRFVYSFDTLENKPDGIRAIVCGMFFSQKRFLDHDGVLEAAGEHPEFSRDLILTWRDWSSASNPVKVPCAYACSGFMKCTIVCTKCCLGGKEKEVNPPKASQEFGGAMLGSLSGQAKSSAWNF